MEKKTKKQLIEEFNEAPIKVDDRVYFYSNNHSPGKEYHGTINKINSDHYIITNNYSGWEEKISFDKVIRKDILSVGANPFKKNASQNIRTVAFDLESIVFSVCGLDRKERTLKTETVESFVIPEINWNPTVKNSNGELIPYQRDFVWTLKDKQLLIESIYNGIQTGKVVIKKNSWEYVRKEAEKGNITGFKDIVDGKQRLNALIEFFSNKFPDLHGNYYEDLCGRAQIELCRYQGMTYGELSEESTDEDVLETFLTVNFTGVQMSPEHIEYVKSINIK